MVRAARRQVAHAEQDGHYAVSYTHLATTPVKGGGNVIKAADLTSKVKKNVGGVVTSVKGQGGTSGTAYTVYSNVPSISPDLLKTANDAAVQAASGSGVTVKSILCFDTVRSGQIIGRMYLNPALNTLTTDIKTGITVGNASVEACLLYTSRCV